METLDKYLIYFIQRKIEEDVAWQRIEGKQNVHSLLVTTIQGASFQGVRKLGYGYEGNIRGTRLISGVRG